MDWWQIALQQPLENLPAWGLMFWVGISIGGQIGKFISSLIVNHAKLQANSQQIITQDNSIQLQLLKEMTERRVEDEKFRQRLADLLDEKVSRIDGTTIRIDSTTVATRGEINKVIAELALLKEDGRKALNGLSKIYHEIAEVKPIQKEGVVT